MKRKNKYTRLIVLIGILVVVLVIFIIYAAWPRLSGTRVILDTAPYDPFDPLRGQYMQIFYEISTVNGSGFAQGDNICVLLEEDLEGISRPKDVSKNKFSKGTFICGVVKDSFNGNLRVEYDIEKYFFERMADVPTENITVEVAVSSGGRARVVRLLQNGKPVEIEYKQVSWSS